MRRIELFLKSGTTLLFVSHSDSAVKAICSRAILLEDGRITRDSDPSSVLDYYRAQQLLKRELGVDSGMGRPEVIDNKHTLLGRSSKTVFSNTSLDEIALEILTADSVLRSGIYSGDEITFRISAKFGNHCKEPHIGFGIRNRLGITVYETNTRCMGIFPQPVKPGESLTVEYTFRCNVSAGSYEAVVGVADGGSSSLSLNRPLFYDQTFTIFEVITNDTLRWSGLCNIEPRIKIIEMDSASARKL
jgi:lipopolysaccharide transport system ATP-binding protein